MTSISFNPDNSQLRDKIIHSSGDAGGMLVGRRHSNNGIKAINKSTGQVIEMEGGEVVITRNAVSDSKKRNFNGQLLTNRQILSKINESGGGVSFAEGGDIPTEIVFDPDAEYICDGKKYCGSDFATYLSNGGEVNNQKKTIPDIDNLMLVMDDADLFADGGLVDMDLVGESKTYRFPLNPQIASLEYKKKPLSLQWGFDAKGSNVKMFYDHEYVPLLLKDRLKKTVLSKSVVISIRAVKYYDYNLHIMVDVPESKGKFTNYLQFVSWLKKNADVLKGTRAGSFGKIEIEYEVYNNNSNEFQVFSGNPIQFRKNATKKQYGFNDLLKPWQFFNLLRWCSKDNSQHLFLATYWLFGMGEFGWYLDFFFNGSYENFIKEYNKTVSSSSLPLTKKDSKVALDEIVIKTNPSTTDSKKASNSLKELGVRDDDIINIMKWNLNDENVQSKKYTRIIADTQNEIEDLITLLPFFDKINDAENRRIILAEITRLQEVSDVNHLGLNRLFRKQVFTPQGLLSYYFEQTTQNPTNNLGEASKLETPNGKESKLPKSTYFNVRSANFKSWFGDWEIAEKTKNYNGCSKCIDNETGEPLVFYHAVRKTFKGQSQNTNFGQGVSRPFGTFDPPNHSVSYFSSDFDYVKFYGGISDNAPKPFPEYKPYIYSVFLNVRNPIDFRDLPMKISYKELKDYLMVKHGLKISYNKDLLLKINQDLKRKLPLWTFTRYDKLLNEELRLAGFDGIIQLGNVPTYNKEGKPNSISKDKIGVEYLTFYPTQVKSATVRNSFYSPYFEDIRFKEGGYVSI